MSDPRTAEWRQEVENDDAAIPKCKRCGGTGEVPIAIYTGPTHPAGDPYMIKYRSCQSCGGLGVETTRGREAKG